MKYKVMLNQFRKVGRYHYILAIAMNITMIFVVYILIVLSVEKTPPEVLCRVNEGETFHKCTLEDYCSKKFQTAIDYENSIDNWRLRHNLVCDREIYFEYLISVVFFFSFVSAMVMSVLGDKMGRLFTYRLESVGCMVALLMIYQDSLPFLFIGVALIQLCSHLHGLSLIYLCEFFHEKPYIIIMVIQNILYGFVGIFMNIYANSFKETRYPLMVIIGLGVFVLAWGFIWLTESPDLLISIYKNSGNAGTKERCKEQLRKNFEYVNDLDYDHQETKKELLESYDKNLALMEGLVPEESVANNSDLEKSKVAATPEENVKRERRHTIQRYDDKSFLRHLFLAIHLWIVNQIVFYVLLTNLPTFEEKIPYASVMFFIGHIIGNTCIAIFSNVIDLRDAATYYSVLSGSSLVILYLWDSIFTNRIISSILFLLFMLFKTCVGEVVYLLVPTLFEPVVRSRATAYSKIPAKLLLVVAPFIIGSNLHMMYLVFGLITWLTPLMMLLLY